MMKINTMRAFRDTYFRYETVALMAKYSMRRDWLPTSILRSTSMRYSGIA